MKYEIRNMKNGKDAVRMIAATHVSCSVLHIPTVERSA